MWGALLGGAPVGFEAPARLAARYTLPHLVSDGATRRRRAEHAAA